MVLATALPPAGSFSLRRRFALTSLLVILGIALGLGWLLRVGLRARTGWWPAMSIPSSCAPTA